MTNLSDMLLARAKAECAARSKRLGIIETPGRLPLAGSPQQAQQEQAARVDAAILRALETRPMLVGDLAEATGFAAKTISGAMQRQRLQGWVTSKPERIGQYGGIPRRYTITAKGRAHVALALDRPAEAQTSAVQGEVEVLAPRAAPEPEMPPAAKSGGFRAGGFVNPLSNEARIARVSVLPAPWAGRDAAE